MSEPAFPCPTGSDGGVYSIGMSLRDYFAAQALQRIIPNTQGADAAKYWERDQLDAEGYFAILAATSYSIADAMLKERSKP